MSYSPTQGPQAPATRPARPNIYTVLLLVAIVALLAAVILVGMRLMSASPEGYGLTFEQLFSPLEKLAP
jgi:hypothetical protein